MTGEAGDECRSIRRGELSREQVLARAEALEMQLTQAIDSSSLPEYPDREAVSEWLHAAHLTAWGLNEQL